ncbi:MAG TPA: creatininase family protein [Opitutaceae bacterium]
MSTARFPIPPPLCIADDATFWPWQRWPQFSTRPERASNVVVVPVVGMADWGLGHALDAEEYVLTSVLRAAAQKKPDDLPLLVVPPLRFVLEPHSECAFPVDAPTAHGFIDEVAASIAAAGFRKIVLFNSSPWNEELCDAAARDLRIARGLQMFCINLSALGLDFLPLRSSHARRWELQTLVTALTGTLPERPASPAATKAPPEAWGEERIEPLTGKIASVEVAASSSEKLLDAAAKRLVGLFKEIHARAPLADEGRISTATP